MAIFASFALFLVLQFFAILIGPTRLTGAAPTNVTKPPGAASGYWLSQIQRQGTVPFGDAAFQVFRNVHEFGAKGDGVTDDSDAINSAITQGSRCGKGCDSSTTTPALVYFPPGTYLVSKPLIQLYYTQFIGDAINVPTLKASAGFKGIAVIDSDPYGDDGANWYTNQNNFFRQVRNFVIDLTAMPPTLGAGIHWQVAQATSLQNIRFEMVKGGDNNKQQGIFMDNGSGGFMTDLTFNGGNYGAFLGNQQFTTRNLTFNDCNTAIYMNWNWLWTFKSLSINRCKVGIDMGALTADGATNNNQTVGSVLVQDSTFVDTPVGVNTSYVQGKNVPVSGGSLVLDNVDFSKCQKAVIGPDAKTILAGGTKIASWAQGHAFTTGTSLSSNPATPATKSGEGVTAGSNGTCPGSNSKLEIGSYEVQKPLAGLKKPASLLDKSGNIYERSKPQYETVPATSFISVKAHGAQGDGKTDDTAALQKIFDTADYDHIIYFDHGAYLISDTIKVPANRKITGEIWPLIMAHGPAFADQKNPKPLFQVGKPGDIGCVEMSDIIFSTKGASPGAILVEWNLAEPKDQQGSSGMWDTHFRLGGFAGSELQSDTCAKNPNITTPASSVTKCEAAFLSLHVTKHAGIYLENNWFWTADHELDRADHSQINIYSGRGVLIESQGGGVWMYGTSAEHSQLYNYQLSNAKEIYMAAIQTETPYMQSNPDALSGGFAPQEKYHDPDFSTCTTAACKKAWGLRVVNSSDVLVYGAGLYSFFDNYAQDCLATESCQENMVDVQCSSQVHLWGLSTKASTNMVTRNGAPAVLQKDNRDNFCSTIALFEEV